MDHLELQHLLKNLRWLRALARQLVQDASQADDIAQEAVTIALRQQAPPRQWRPWLFNVMRNLARARSRGRQRELHHLASLAERTEHVDASAVLERAEAQQTVARAVFQLGEPYRSTVLLRFFEGLSPGEIAARCAVPVATVHSRLQRALQQLRGQLDQRFGCRSAWRALLLPVLPHDPPAPPAQRWSVAAASTAGVALATLILFVMSTWRTELAPAISQQATSGPSMSEPSAIAAPTAAGGSAQQDSRNPAALPTTVPTPVQPTMTGRLIDLAGAPLGFEVITYSPGLPTTPNQAIEVGYTDAQGVFVMPAPAAAGVVRVGGPRYCPLLAGHCVEGATSAGVIVAAPAVHIAGQVVDASGRPATAGTVSVEHPTRLLAAALALAPASLRVAYDEPVHVDGSFELVAPYAGGAVLSVSVPGFEPVAMALPPASCPDLRVVVGALAPSNETLVGTVLGIDGVPASDAIVAMGVTSVQTDASGRFALSLRRAGSIGELVAARPGFAPARCAPPPKGELADRWPSPLVLRLGEPTGSVAGVVFDGDRPVAGAEVWIDDPSPFAVVGDHPIALEFYLGGGGLSVNGRPIPPAHPDWINGPAPASRVAVGQASNEPMPTARWNFATTDARGSFVIAGLLARSYRLRAFDPGRGWFAPRVTVRAGDAVSLRLEQPPDDGIVGRLLTPRGDCVAGASASVKWIAFATSARTPSGTTHVRMLRAGPTSETDADGFFRLASNVAADGVVVVYGDDILPEHVEGRTFLLGQTRDVTVQRRHVVDVALADPGEATAVFFVDGEGRLERHYLALTARHIDVRQNSRLDGGRSGRLVIGELAVECRLTRDGKVVRSVPLAFSPGGCTLVQ